MGTKIGKGVQKAENFASNLRKVLDLNKGDSQQELIRELIKEANKNLGDTSKKVKDTAKPEVRNEKTGCDLAARMLQFEVLKKRGIVHFTA